MGLIKSQSSSEQRFSELYDFIKIILTLSHGNAALERGFSINKECIVENQLGPSLIAQRVICDAVISNDKQLHPSMIEKDMILAARNAHNLYKEAVERNKKENEKKKQRHMSAKEEAQLLANLESKEMQLKEQFIKKTAAVHDKMRALKRRKL